MKLLLLTKCPVLSVNFMATQPRSTGYKPVGDVVRSLLTTGT